MSNYNEQALDQMVESIVKNGKLKVDRDIKRKQKELQQMDEAKRNELQQNLTQKQLHIEKQVEDEFSQFTLAKRRRLDEDVMKKKREYRDELFQAFVIRMRESLEGSLQEKMRSVVQQLSFHSDTVNVRVGEFSKNELTAEYFSSISNDQVTFVLDNDGIANDGGCVFSDQGILYDFTFSSSCEDIMESYAPTYMNELSAYE